MLVGCGRFRFTPKKVLDRLDIETPIGPLKGMFLRTELDGRRLYITPRTVQEVAAADADIEDRAELMYADALRRNRVSTSVPERGGVGVLEGGGGAVAAGVAVDAGVLHEHARHRGHAAESRASRPAPTAASAAGPWRSG